MRKQEFKFIVFLEVMALFLAGMIHVIVIATGHETNNVPAFYSLVFALTLAVCLFTKYILIPIEDWWFNE